jgi:preprotein translocase subunit SecY
MDFMKVGTLSILGGCFAMLLDTRLGVVGIGVGALLIIASGEEKEPVKAQKPGESVSPSEVHYKVIGNQVLMLDAEGNVLGATDVKDDKIKRVGSNRK